MTTEMTVSEKWYRGLTPDEQDLADELGRDSGTDAELLRAHRERMMLCVHCGHSGAAHPCTICDYCQGYTHDTL